ncbi:TIGR00730 family Rossman fold protein [Thermomonas sp.]|jgi:uncharacterized protein (TIGR00730 family)|uniref:LOG family protein n=1 Tax=Thermomonas sp. TaxID=1971895 RepID=UPI001ACDBF7E|nr:TIGR00730 family Rossman fold protein [Xanthomonadales bacterium]MBN8795188.1 TIGR00730 family Rossman fold protein [Stenotrophomonas nitritireducens]
MNDREDLDRLRERIMQSPAYQLAHEDPAFLTHDDLRPLRLQMEFLKPEHALREQGIASTVVVFGSARIPAPEQAVGCGSPADTAAASRPRPHRHAHLYDEARRFARIVSTRFQQQGRRDFVIMTGGGPGIMEAANRGAFEAGARSIGLNITLPHEQAPNPYLTPELAFRFHYFALRKMHFLLRAKALVAFPGGYGTLDELFEVLTLVQTGKMPRIPIVLVGRAFWQRAVDFQYLADEGFISAQDTALFTLADRAEEIVSALTAFYQGRPPGTDAAPS